jgi:hypothetical protein
MFFHVDESGNSGNNLFDANQPVLSYGVLSSRWDVDAHGIAEHAALVRAAEAASIHANKLGDAGLVKLAPGLIALHRQFEFRFDYYFVHKPSFVATTFFNAVFDAGLNEAMKWDWYWTPLRFPLVAALASVMTDEIAREAWRLCSVPRGRVAAEAPQVKSLLKKTLERIEAEKMDGRMREVMADALRYGIAHPENMDFGIYSPTALAPNTIGFQFVLTAIARRQQQTKEKALRITVDRQTQFNKAQIETYNHQAKLASALRHGPADRKRYLAHPFMEGAREDVEALIGHFPEESLTIAESDRTIGLQLADTYLWLLNRLINGKAIPKPLRPLVGAIAEDALIDGISIEAMLHRFANFEKKLPAYESLTPAQMALGKASVDAHRKKVKDLGGGS